MSTASCFRSCAGSSTHVFKIFRRLAALNARTPPASLVGAEIVYAEDIHSALQSADAIETEAFRRLEARFREWYAWTMDLPGRYYLEVIERLYLNNELATGHFPVLGRRIDLATVTIPVYLLAAVMIMWSRRLKLWRFGVWSEHAPPRSATRWRLATILGCLWGVERSPTSGAKLGAG